MPITLSNLLSPRAKKTFLKCAADLRVGGILQVAPTIDRERFVQSLAQHDTAISAWPEAQDWVSIDTVAGRLPELADLDDVVYVEVGDRYGV